MFGIGFADWFTLSLYFVGIIIIGVWTAKRIKDTADFFIGGRRFGKTFMVLFAFGAGTNGNQAVAVASGTYRTGMSGIWWQWLWIFATPFYWIIAPIFRRMRAVTTGDYFDMRYDPSVGALYAVVGTLQLSANIGVMLLGAGKVITALSGGTIPLAWAIPLLTVLFVFYGVAGGLSAAIITDFIQGILTVLLSFMVLPFAFKAVGGFTGLHEKIGDPGMFEIVAGKAGGELTVFYVAMIALNATVGIVCQPHIMGVCAAGRNEMDGRVGFAGGNLLKRVCTVAWMLTGLCAVVLYPNLTGEKVDETYGLMARELLPKVMPGLVGVFLAALLASVMSSCDAFMVSCSGLVTQNIYKRYMAPEKGESHYIFVGRIVSVAIVALSLWFAFQFEDVVEGLKVFWKFSAVMAAAFWAGLFWRRATVAGAWAGTIATFAVWLVTTLPFFDTCAQRHLPDRMVKWSRVAAESEVATVRVRLASGQEVVGATRAWRAVYLDSQGTELLGIQSEAKYDEATKRYTVKAKPGYEPEEIDNVMKADYFKPVYRDPSGEILVGVVEELPQIMRTEGVFAQIKTEGGAGKDTEEIEANREWRPLDSSLPWPERQWHSVCTDAMGAVLPLGTVRVRPEFLDSWQIVFYLSAGMLVTILVSLLTKRVPKDRLDRLYNCLRTPVGENEPHLEPFTLPEGVEPGPPNKLIDHPDFEIPKMSLVGFAGFAFFWVMVVLMIGFVFWMAGWGA